MVAIRLQEPAGNLQGNLEEWVIGKDTLPEYLRQLRRARHYRQEFVASQLNIARQTYSHYETGRIRPSARTLYSLAKLYGVPVEEMFSYMESPQMKMHTEEDTADLKMENQFLYYFRSLDEGDRREILSIMQIKIKNQNEDAGCEMEEKEHLK